MERHPRLALGIIIIAALCIIFGTLNAFLFHNDGLGLLCVLIAAACFVDSIILVYAARKAKRGGDK